MMMSVTAEVCAAWTELLHSPLSGAQSLSPGVLTCYRALDFGKAQRTAMTLHRLKGHSRLDCLWWIVTCLVLQARQAGADVSSLKGAGVQKMF